MIPRKPCPNKQEGGEKKCIDTRRAAGFPDQKNLALDQWQSTECANCRTGKERERRLASIRPRTCSRCGEPVKGFARGRIRNTQEHCAGCAAFVKRQRLRRAG